jgi:hypothetical protein
MVFAKQAFVLLGEKTDGRRCSELVTLKSDEHGVSHRHCIADEKNSGD